MKIYFNLKLLPLIPDKGEKQASSKRINIYRQSLMIAKMLKRLSCFNTDSIRSGHSHLIGTPY